MTLTKTAYLTAAFLSLSLTLRGQVFPGDANNDGQVSHYDILYVGYAYGAVGPARVNPGAAFGEQPVAVWWPEEFPDGLNYAFADANGSGLVEWGDLSSVFSNYGNQHGTVVPPALPIGVEGTDIPLEIGPVPPGEIYSSGSRIELPVVLGNPQFPVSSFNGIAFSVGYDAAYIQDAYFELTAPWLGPQGVFHFQSEEAFGSGKFDVAITHYGSSPGSNGFGALGKVHFIVEDVLVDLMEGYDSTDITLYLEGAMMVDSSFNLIPVVLDSVKVRIYNPGVISNIPTQVVPEEVVAFPNPTSGEIWIRSSKPIRQINLYNFLGQRVQQWEGGDERLLQLPLHQSGLPPGACFLEVATTTGIFKRKVIFASR